MQLLALFLIKNHQCLVKNQLKNNYTLHVKCLSLQSVQVLTELSCHSYLEGSAVAAAASAAGLARPVVGLIVSIATNV
jgi:zinc transporter ZupT